MVYSLAMDILLLAKLSWHHHFEMADPPCLRTAGYFTVLALSQCVLVGCGGLESVDVENLDAKWSISVDHSTRRVRAEGSVSTSYSEYRLTEGDVLRLVWAGKTWQLYRVDAPYVYTRDFALPENSNAFQARFDRARTAFLPVVVDVTLPDMGSSSLVEDGMVLPETGALNLSWEIDVSQFSITSQFAEVQLLDCEAVLNADNTLINLGDAATQTATLQLQELPRPAAGSEQTCRYSIQHSVNTFTGEASTEKASSVSVDNRSRLFEVSVTFGSG